MRIARPVAIFIVISIGAIVFTYGISWGLPSRAVDRFLFGSHEVWDGATIQKLAGARDEKLGADVASHPIAPSTQPVLLNATDEDRARIIRRYRLYTHQPDEMITLMALSRMNGRQLDPGLYQYGGLWIYPIGGLIKAAVMLHLVQLKNSPEYYLDHPEEFGKFYIIARLYSATWGIVAVALAMRLLRDTGIGMFIGALVVALLPVVVNSAHEAKPHLAGAALTLAAVICAARFVRSGKLRDAIFVGVACGAAAGMVLSASVAIVVVPAMVLLRPMKWNDRARFAFSAIVAAMLIYFACNPFVAIHLLGDRSLLHSNLGNSRAMYVPSFSLASLYHAMHLTWQGAGLGGAFFGILGAYYLLRANVRTEDWLLASVGGVVAIGFILFASGKPAEYARFAIFLDVALAIFAVRWIALTTPEPANRALLAVLATMTSFASSKYDDAYMTDAQGISRMFKSTAIAIQKINGAKSIAVFEEPAPYLLPAVDLFSWDVYLLPRGFEMEKDAPVDVIVQAVDAVGDSDVAGKYHRERMGTVADTPISWADKAMEIWVKTTRNTSKNLSTNLHE